MWIKHNNALYNTDDMYEIKVYRTQIRARFKTTNEVEVIGSFRTVEEAEGILRSISQSLLFEDKEHPGIIIKDTKVVKK